MKVILRTFAIIVSFISAGQYAEAQISAANKPDSSGNGQGAVIIHQDARVDSILQMHIAYNKQQKGIDGYRIQIFFDAGNNSLNRATAVAGQFQLLFPGDTAYISFSEPYYKVRVGDFRTRLDAEGFLQEILPDFPNAFVIKDKINYPKPE